MAPDGKTAVGHGGGDVIGSGGVEVRIPEDAVMDGVAAILKIASLLPQDLPPGFLADLPDATIASALKIESPDPPSFEKEVDLVFPKPADAPDKAVFFVYRRLTGPDGAMAYEALDVADVEGTGADAKVVTASFPLAGYRSSINGYTATGLDVGGGVGNQFDNYAVLMWAADSQTPARTLGGTITGQVLRAQYTPGSETPTYVPVEDAIVSAVDVNGTPLFKLPNPSTPPVIGVSQKQTGTFAFFDLRYTGGPVTISATLPNGDTRMSTAYEITPNVADAPGLRFSKNVATATITFPAITPTAPPSPVQVHVLTLDQDGNRHATTGIVVAGTPLVLGVKAPEMTVQHVTVTGGSQTTEYGVRVDPVPNTPLSMDVIADGSLTFAQPGTYTITATALAAFGGVVTGHTTIRAVAAGGSNNDALPDDAPAVITARTVPKADAKGVPIGVLPQIVFTEPVTHVPGAVTLTEEGGGTVGITLSGVGPSGPIETLGPDSVVTSITIQPVAGLKYNTRYTLALSEAIVDTDDGTNNTPANKPLVPYTTNFTTFAPESIGRTTETFTAGGMTVIGDRAYIATPQDIGRPFTALRLFNVSDPTQPAEITSDQPGTPLVTPAPATFLGAPVDVVGEETSPLTGGPVVAVSSAPITIPFHPSNVRLYDVADDQNWKWIGAVTLGKDPVDGIIRRTEMHGERLYAVTAGVGKGIQVVDLARAKDLFTAATIDGDQSTAYWQMQGQLNTAGGGFAQEAIVQSIYVDTSLVPQPTGAPPVSSQLNDLAVIDLPVDGLTQPIVVATGRSPLVIANPQTGELLYNGHIVDDEIGELTSWGYGVAAGMVHGIPMAVVAALNPIGPTPNPPSYPLAIVDLSTPRAPTPLGTVAVSGLAANVQDVILRGSIVYIGTTTGTIMVSLEDPVHPRLIGTVATGGRLAFQQDAILLGTLRSTVPSDSIDGGLRTSAMGGPLVIVPHLRPQLTRNVIPLPNTAGPDEEEFVNAVPIPTQVIGANAISGVLSIRANGVEIAQLALNFVKNTALAQIARATRKLKDAVWSVAALVDTDDGQVASLPRRIDVGQVELLVDADNNTKVEPADRQAMDAGKAWAFWEADPENLSAFEVIDVVLNDSRKPTMSGLADFGTVRMTVTAPTDDLEIRVVSDFPSTVTKWSLTAKAGSALEYVTKPTTGEAERELVKSDCSARGAMLLGRCDATGATGVKLHNVQPGHYEYLFRCEACPIDATRRLEVIQPAITGAPTALDRARVDIRPLHDWMAMLTARRGANGDKVDGVLRPLPGYAPVSNRNGITTTVLVHGYGVNAEEAQASYRQLLRNLYWSGLPVLFDAVSPSGPFVQENATQVVGVLWPGNVGSTGKTYFPGDEFTAFQTGVPLASFFEERKLAGQKLNIVAHSLGNLAVNSAITRTNSLTFDDRFAMVEPAVATEAFVTDYDPSNDASFADPSTPLLQMVETFGGAKSEGFPTTDNTFPDSIWVQRWLGTLCLPDSKPPDCGPAPEIWGRFEIQMHPDLTPRPSYFRRWATADFGFSPWRGIFASNVGRVTMLNFFNRDDQALQIVSAVPSPWRLAQVAQKPYVGILGTGPDVDGLSWALNDFVRADDDFYALWNATPDGLTQRAARMRRWAELSFQLQPVSGPAGAQPMPGIPPSNNFDQTRVGGDGGLFTGYSSHTYWTQPISRVKDFLELLASRLNR